IPPLTTSTSFPYTTLFRSKPDSYKALVEQQQAAISAAKAMNLQAKATLAKTEQDLKRSQDLFTKKMISESEFNTAQTARDVASRSEEHTSELQSPDHLVCR